MTLGPPQEDLLVKLVEAERAVLLQNRRPFILLWTHDRPNPILIHPGWPQDECVYEPDALLLQADGLLHITGRTSSGFGFVVTPGGHEYYAQLQRREGQPLVHLEQRVHSFVSGDWFGTRYVTAQAKWRAAEELLWESDSTSSFSAIGHYAREAMIEFADTLATRFKVYAPADRSKTVARIKAVIEHLRPELGNRTSDFLAALVVYWGTVSDLAQRLEHAVSHQGHPLAHDDARRVVFHTALVFFELDQVCERVGYPRQIAG